MTKTGKQLLLKKTDKGTQEILPVRLFRKMGYLQEVNRNFLHPLGLALSVDKHDDGSESIYGVLVTSDHAGFVYDDTYINSAEAVSKAQFVAERRAAMAEPRLRELGFIVQPMQVSVDGTSDANAIIDSLVEICKTLSQNDLEAFVKKLVTDGELGKALGDVIKKLLDGVDLDDETKEIVYKNLEDLYD